MRRRILLIGTLAIAACAAPEPPDSAGDRVRVGVLPDESAPTLRDRYEPLVEHLAASSGLELELVIPRSYDELLDWFHEDRVQLAWFGGLTFLHAERRSDARPLVMRDVDLDFTTDFLVAGPRTEESLREFADATFSFGPRLSTSGHLMPRYYLVRHGIDPEAFYSEVRHSSGHDQTALSVQDGRVDVGAVNSVVVESMFRDGRLSAGGVRVLHRTSPYRNYVWAVRPDLPASTRIVLQDAFLGLDASVAEHAALLAGQGALSFVPASHSDYENLRRAAEQLGFLDGGEP